MGAKNLGGKKDLSRIATVFLLGTLLAAGTACGPRQNAFSMKELEGLEALPGGDIDPTIFDSTSESNADKKTTTSPPTQVGRPRDTNTPAEPLAKNNQVPRREPLVQVLETAPYPADRDESQLDRVRSRVSPGGIFDSTGRPRRDYTKRLKERFGDRLNQPVTKDKISAQELTKSQKMFREIQRAVDRGQEPVPALMFMASSDAIARSKAFEATGEISKAGAWTIATEGTAKRHGFGNVPCAEFMSEVIRQAYARAGYRIEEDFNAKNSNKLIWTDTASVTGLSKALFKAGWVPYTAHHFRPPVGAIMFHTVGLSPSHTYAAAGLDGLKIVDNGAPQGRDLRQTKAKTLNLMFHSGFFMLPPGITPQAWPDPKIPMS
jgi:hypothetical protein